MSGEFFQLPPNTVAQAWPVIRPRIMSGVERSTGRLTEMAAFDYIASGKWQCWVYWEAGECLAACITRINVHSSGSKSVEAIMASGDHREKWQRLAVETWKKFAKSEGCSLLELYARPGWERVFTEFKKTHVVLELRID